VDLNGNTEHATCHGISADEIIQVLANKPRISRNQNHRSAGYSAFGPTDGGPTGPCQLPLRPRQTLRPTDQRVGGPMTTHPDFEMMTDQCRFDCLRTRPAQFGLRPSKPG
jgi:hypothetical protein